MIPSIEAEARHMDTVADTQRVLRSMADDMALLRTRRDAIKDDAPDVARHLSLAITELENAELRLQRAHALLGGT